MGSFYSFIDSVIFGCVGSSLLHAGLLWLHCSSLGVRASDGGDFSCCGAWAPGAWAESLCSMWDLPGPRLQLVSFALPGGFLTTVPPGKPQFYPHFKIPYRQKSCFACSGGRGALLSLLCPNTTFLMPISLEHTQLLV